MAAQQDSGTVQENWQAILQEEKESAFRQLVEPYMETLLQAARRNLHYYVLQGHLSRQDFTPEEVVGEGLIHAWQQRSRRPEKMSLRGWLLGTQYRALRGMVAKQQTYRQEKALSLDEPLPTDAATDDKQEWFWEWYQPDANITWEDVIPATEPVDLEIPLYASRNTILLDTDTWHVLTLHDEFEVPLPEVAFTMNQAVNETAKLLDHARTTLRERLGDNQDQEITDDPAPPEESEM